MTRYNTKAGCVALPTVMALILGAAAAATARSPVSATLGDAKALAQRVLILDGHIDLPYRLKNEGGQEAAANRAILTGDKGGNFDLPRARAGGLDAPFFSIYVPARYQQGGARRYADGLIDRVERLLLAAPRDMTLARTVDEVESVTAKKRLAVLLGMENGAPIEHDLANLRHFFRRGVRYITLTHSKDNQIADSSYATTRTWDGLSPFGKKVVREMNRLGIMVDISHVSDAAFFQALELSQAPVIASHSSCRHFTPGFERNMSDDMIRALASRGGVVQINFGSTFISQKSRDWFKSRDAAVEAFMKEKDLKNEDAPRVAAFRRRYERKHPRVFATVDDVADHIDHVVKLVGVDHVGLGSDFDGVGNTLPIGLKDVSDYPRLIQVLMRRGYSEEDIRKICGANVLRVWRQVEATAVKLSQAPRRSESRVS